MNYEHVPTLLWFVSIIWALIALYLVIVVAYDFYHYHKQLYRKFITSVKRRFFKKG